MSIMYFSYEDFQDADINYSHRYDCYLTLDKSKYDKQSEESLKLDSRVKDTLGELKERTTNGYYTKVYKAQVDAKSYAEKVFPTYKFIQHDAIIDDWLSTVDFHRKKKTRDHSLHQTLTAYIVSKMLGQGDSTKGLVLPNGKTLLQQCAEQLLREPQMEYLRNYVRRVDPDFAPYSGKYSDAWAAEVFYEAAFISALFHDMGYPWQYVYNLSRSIKDANYKDVNGVVIDVDKAANKMSDSLLIYPLYGYQEDVVKTPTDEQKQKVKELIRKGLMDTHGMPGAIGFMWLNSYIRYEAKKDLFKEASFRLITDWAAVGIMMHDMPRVYWGDRTGGQPDNSILRLDSKKDPLSCITSLADILEEFERPKADFYRVLDKNDNEHVAVDYDFLCNETVVGFDGDKMNVTYLYDTEEEARKQESDRKNEVKDYLGTGIGYLNLVSWGINDGEAQTRKKSQV